jgi:hypothetical protein
VLPFRVILSFGELRRLNNHRFDSDGNSTSLSKINQHSPPIANRSVLLRQFFCCGAHKARTGEETLNEPSEDDGTNAAFNSPAKCRIFPCVGLDVRSEAQ